MPPKGAAMKIISVKTKPIAALLILCIVLSAVSVAAFASGINYIKKIHVSYTYVEYKAGEAPRATAAVTEGECTVAYEYWREIHQLEAGGVWSGTGRYWYSDPAKSRSPVLRPASITHTISFLPQTEAALSAMMRP